MVAYRPLAKSLPARIFFGHTFNWHTANTYGGGQSTDGVQALKRKSGGEVINEKLWGTAMDIVIYRCAWSWVDWVWLHYFLPFRLIFLSSEQSLHHLAFDVVVLEDMKPVLKFVRNSSSHIGLLPHHHSLCTTHLHWCISTPLPLQPGLGVEELGLEKGKGQL